MRRLFLVISIAIATLLFRADIVSADSRVVSESARLKITYIDQVADPRVAELRSFLEKYNSPLAAYAQKLIVEADKNGLDWRLIPAISGVESTFGKNIPADSYNAYGWVNGAYKFTSWDNSIETVAKTLRQNYLDRGALSIDEIARIYAPPSTTWAGKVRYFMLKIDATPLSFSLEG